MKRRITRLAAVVVSVAGFGAAAAPAMASVSATTLPATQIARTSAALNGTITTDGTATTYTFEYGTDTNYGDFTGTGVIPASSGPQTVNVQKFANDLTPGTTYHFALQATAQVSSTNIEFSQGNDVTFNSVSNGTIALRGGNAFAIPYGSHKVAFRLSCVSAMQNCGGYIEANLFGSQQIQCFSQPFNIPPGMTESITATASSHCVSTIRQTSSAASPNARLNIVVPFTGQPGISKNVTLYVAGKPKPKSKPKPKPKHKKQHTLTTGSSGTSAG